MRATTTCQPKLTAAAMLAKRRGQARRCDRQALIRTVLVRRPASGPSTKAQYLRPTAANASVAAVGLRDWALVLGPLAGRLTSTVLIDRKSTRLNSSHTVI